MHVASDGIVEFSGHRIVADAELERLEIGQVCVHIAVTATSPTSPPVRVDQFALGVIGDVGRPTEASSPTAASHLAPATGFGLESAGRICARPRAQSQAAVVLRWHPGGIDDPVGVWLYSPAAGPRSGRR